MPKGTAQRLWPPFYNSSAEPPSGGPRMFQLNRQKRSQRKSAKKEIVLHEERAPSRIAQDGDSLSATTIPNAADA